MRANYTLYYVDYFYTKTNTVSLPGNWAKAVTGEALEVSTDDSEDPFVILGVWWREQHNYMYTSNITDHEQSIQLDYCII